MAELIIDSPGGMIVDRHFGLLFKCRRHLTGGAGAHLSVPIIETIANPFYRIAGAYDSKEP